MSPQSKRTYNTAVGGLFLGLGVIAWGIAAYFAVTPVDKSKALPATPPPVVDAAACRTLASTVYGFEAKLVGTEIHISMPRAFGFDNAQAWLKDSTALIGLCKRTMKSFCLGPDCGQDHMLMVLSGPGAAPGAASSVPTQPAPGQASGAASGGKK